MQATGTNSPRAAHAAATAFETKQHLMRNVYSPQQQRRLQQDTLSALQRSSDFTDRLNESLNNNKDGGSNNDDVDDDEALVDRDHGNAVDDEVDNHTLELQPNDVTVVSPLPVKKETSGTGRSTADSENDDVDATAKSTANDHPETASLDFSLSNDEDDDEKEHIDEDFDDRNDDSENAVENVDDDDDNDDDNVRKPTSAVDELNKKTEQLENDFTSRMHNLISQFRPGQFRPPFFLLLCVEGCCCRIRPSNGHSFPI